MRLSFSSASCSWQLRPLLADRSAQAAEVVAEPPNGGLELRDAAQQHGDAFVARAQALLSKATHSAQMHTAL